MQPFKVNTNKRAGLKRTQVTSWKSSIPVTVLHLSKKQNCVEPSVTGRELEERTSPCLTECYLNFRLQKVIIIIIIEQKKMEMFYSALISEHLLTGSDVTAALLLHFFLQK